MDNSDKCSSITWQTPPTGSAAFLLQQTNKNPRKDTESRCAAATTNQHKCLGLRVVGSLCLLSARQCGGGSLGPWCCPHCGGEAPTRIIQMTLDEGLHYMLCLWTDWKYCTAERWPATMSTGQWHADYVFFSPYAHYINYLSFIRLLLSIRSEVRDTSAL